MPTNHIRYGRATVIRCVTPPSRLPTLPITTCPVGGRVPTRDLGAKFDRAGRKYYWVDGPCFGGDEARS